MNTNEDRLTVHSDIFIAGAGFAGSLAALCLHQLGFSVILVEKKSHPRFAIGESSTPIADMILRDLSDRYDLPWLYDFSRYGSWQQSHPKITCGLKRGFSYYNHKKGSSFVTDGNHKNELLVAASSSDENSDTNWLRSDIDAFLVEKVKQYGIKYFDNTEIKNCEKDQKWKFGAKREQKAITFKADFFIDATGGPALLKRLLDVNSSSEEFLTNSRALYSHFENVSRWTEKLQKRGIPTADYPYDPDHSALHHLIDGGWIWMLRFNNERTSMGIMLNRERFTGIPNMSPEEEWQSIVSNYPSIQKMVDSAQLSSDPGRIFRTGRLQRRLTKAMGEGWVALPHTIGFVDPLHSAGIALTLSGLEKVIAILANYWDEREQLNLELKSYEKGVAKELDLIDKLIAGCYQGINHFELFNVYSMLYFTAAISYEQKRLRGQRPSHFLSAGDRDIHRLVQESYRDLQQIMAQDEISAEMISNFKQSVRNRIQPYNIAGLLDPAANNMYHHTVAEL